MSDRENAEKSKELFNKLSEALDARNQWILESGPEDEGYYPRLKELDKEMWSAHSRWRDSIASN